MSPVTHFFAGWLLASVSPTGRPTTLTRREKALVVAAAVAPDIDGIGIVPELLTRNTSHPLLWFSEYHHSLHTLAFALFAPLPLTSSRARWPRPFGHGSSVSDFTFGPAIRNRRFTEPLNPPLAFSPWTHRVPGLRQLPPSPAVRPHRRPRPRRRPMAHPLPQAILQFSPTRMARPVGAQRLAEFCDHRLALC